MFAELYARGLSVFPLKPRDKVPDPDMLPLVREPDGTERRTWKPFSEHPAERAQIDRWEAEGARRRSNVGIACGPVSGVLVVDVDGPEGEAAVAAAGGLPTSWQVRTRQGRHVYLRFPIGEELRNRNGALPKVDIRVAGGYVVGAGSVHPSGHVYAWEIGPNDAPLADPPDWLLELVRPEKPEPAPEAPPRLRVVEGTGGGATASYGRAALEREAEAVAGAPFGEQEKTLNNAAFRMGTLVAAGALDRAEAEAALVAAGARMANQPGKPVWRVEGPQGIRKKVVDGVADGMRHPRPLPETVTSRDAGGGGGAARGPNGPRPNPRAAPPRREPPPPPPVEPEGDEPDVVAGRIRALGRDGSSFYFLNGASQVQALQARDLGKPHGLYQLAPRQWWYDHLSVMEGEQRRLPLDAIMARLMEACDRVGVFRPGRVRGTGVWWSQRDGAVVHLGDRLVVGGEVMPPSDYSDGDTVYEARPRLDVDPAPPLAVERARLLLDACDLVGWDEPGSGRLLAGWIVCAIIGGAIPWRPHVLLTGSSSSGKSWIIDNIIAPTLEGRGGRNVERTDSAATTQAGIRQHLGPDARPVLFDEADVGGDERARMRQQAVIEFLRAAASGGYILQGSQNHAGVRYAAHSCGLIAGIGVPLDRAADASRFAVLEFHKVTGDAFADLQRASLPLRVDGFRVGLFWRAAFATHRVRADAALLIEAMGERLPNRRVGDLYGHLLAAARVLETDEGLADLDAAHAYIAPILDAKPEWARATGERNLNDEEDVLGRILAIQLRVEVQGAVPDREGRDTGRTRTEIVTRTVHELIETAAAVAEKPDPVVSQEDANNALSRHGVRVNIKIDRWPLFGVVAFANNNPFLDEALRGTIFSSATTRQRVLSRLPGAVHHTSSHRFLSVAKSRAVFIPVRVVLAIGPEPAERP